MERLGAPWRAAAAYSVENCFVRGQRGVGFTDSGRAYWSGTEYAPNPGAAWYFSTVNGGQDGSGKGKGIVLPD